ncbi:MAG: hypothetical protein A2156_13715 [Deltaproteobacteria bacterium RBG_16_48_10]|nr:MAG: hypothetical protein A2156_13715 [Deltaproteobacteria bacterium RBG_16_48_10]
MTHRERLMAAVSHRQPDKVPIDLGGTRDSTIVVEVYERLKKHFRIEGENKLCDRMMQVVEVDKNILGSNKTIKSHQIYISARRLPLMIYPPLL